MCEITVEHEDDAIFLLNMYPPIESTLKKILNIYPLSSGKQIKRMITSVPLEIELG